MTDNKLEGITRRDFLNGALLGTGAALLTANAPALAKAINKQINVSAQDIAWNGPAGTGDYALSNGNVASTRKAAHLIRDGLTSQLMSQVKDVDDEYDLVIIGGGFSGLGAAYQAKKQFGDGKKVLIIENHPVFGGEAKQNEFQVDGYTLYGPQGSNDFGMPDPNDDDLITQIYHDTGLPFKLDYLTPQDGSSKLKVPLDNYYCVYWEEDRYDHGYFAGPNAEHPWVVNPKQDHLARMPWSDEFKAEMNRAFADKDHYAEDNEDYWRWLDSMSYKDLLEKKLGYSGKVTEFYDPIIAISMGGVGGDAYSAYAAKVLEMPGTQVHYTYDINEESAFSYPGGNSAIYRHILKFIKPETLKGGTEFEELLYAPIAFDKLDQKGDAFRVRLNATAIDVRHKNNDHNAEVVEVTYNQNDRIERVRTKAVVSSIGGWVGRNIVKDLPLSFTEAYEHFHHSPVLVVNVALRQWRFLDKIGIAAGRWFEGFGRFFSIRRPLNTGKLTQPFHPDKPIVMTFYVPFNNPGLPVAQQGAVGRAEMLSKSYADYEKEIVDQMNLMFADYGFDAQRDIAGITLNRWGHAFISPQPGFHYGLNGNPAPKDVIKQGYGRIHFGHSELSGYMSHTSALEEGARAAKQALAKV